MGGEHHSPLSSGEVMSEAASPFVLRPTVLMSQKSRSSSMGSNASNRTRSSSIVSLDSPRNSIVSIDDSGLLPSRNNSTGSLSSLSGVKKPVLYPKSKIKKKSSFAEQLHFKKDFKFKYQEQKKKNKLSFEINKTVPKEKPTVDSNNHILPNATKLIEADLHHDKISKVKAVSNKNNSIQHPLHLKKNMLFSKELQLELLNLSSTGVDKHTEAKFNLTAQDDADPINLSSQGPTVTDFNNQPIINTLQLQNQILAKLNNRWNASSVTQHDGKKFDLSSAIEAETKKDLEEINQKKRSRLDLFDD